MGPTVVPDCPDMAMTPEVIPPSRITRMLVPERPPQM
jgi:hypothetical protein